MGNTDTSDKNTSELEIKQNQSLQPAEVEMMDIKSNSQQQQLLLTGTTPAAAPREALIHTAITFLLNPNVKRSPLNQKQKFLRSKGLTDDEIQIACERAGVFSIDPNSSIINIPNNNNNNNNTGGILQSGSSLSSNNMVYSPPVKTKQTTLQKIKDILTSTALIAGITYAIYLFYKKFIEPILFRKKKKKTISESLDEMDKKFEKNIVDLNYELVKIKDEITTTLRNTSLTRDMQNFKTDLELIKGLLLNRKQFSGLVVPPSIPAWQLQSQMTQVTDNETEKNDDAGSGSGSSETEVVTKNSDSSIEMM